MKSIELIGHVDEQHRLCVEVPAQVPPGAVKVTLEAVGEDADDWWAAAVSQSWAADWSDPREDIYSRFE
jgi:hypothetical protein